MALNEYQFIKIYEHKNVGPYVVAKVAYAVWLNFGKSLSSSFTRTLIFIPKDRSKEIEISDFLDYEDIPENQRDNERAQFGAHRITNLENWNDTGDAAENCSNYEQFKTPLDIERYLEEHPCGWW